MGGNGKHQITLQNIGPEDVGEISCIAKNEIGEAKCSAKFDLEGADEDVITPTAVQTTQTAAQKSSSTDYRDEPARHEKITSEPKPRKTDLDDLVEGPNERQRQLETGADNEDTEFKMVKPH